MYSTYSRKFHLRVTCMYSVHVPLLMYATRTCTCTYIYVCIHAHVLVLVKRKSIFLPQAQGNVLRLSFFSELLAQCCLILPLPYSASCDSKNDDTNNEYIRYGNTCTYACDRKKCTDARTQRHVCTLYTIFMYTQFAATVFYHAKRICTDTCTL